MVELLHYIDFGFQKSHDEKTSNDHKFW